MQEQRTAHLNGKVVTFFDLTAQSPAEAMVSDMKHLIELTETSFEPEVLNARTPVVVDFYAP